jgi:xanthine dehydrogenase small subunit
VAGREVTTLDGLPVGQADRWAEALVASGGSQCGFCTPGIIMRLAALQTPPGDPGAPAAMAKVPQSLVAHLCRCTGWQSIEEAAAAVLGGDLSPTVPRDFAAAGRRATLEGGAPQRVGPEIARGQAGFADDRAPLDALVAVPDGHGGYAVAEQLGEARRLAGKVQGRRTTVPPGHPVALPAGPWALTLRTTWVEPGYVEPDASWCVPGGTPASPTANGGAFGGKRGATVGEVARRLADRHGRAVRVLWSREDVVRLGPKRPPVAIGMDADGSGILRLGVSGSPWTEEELAPVRRLVSSVAPGLAVEQVPVVGPPVSLDLRAAGWAEAAVVEAVRRAGGHRSGPVTDVPIEVVAPSGGRAVAVCRADGSIEVTLGGGAVLDPVVLRSYGIGAAHQALGWVTSEGLAVDAAGAVGDLTIRSFGILAARATPPITVVVEDHPAREPVNASDAALVAVAAARWLADGLAPEWPSGGERALPGLGLGAGGPGPAPG